MDHWAGDLVVMVVMIGPLLRVGRSTVVVVAVLVDLVVAVVAK